MRITAALLALLTVWSAPTAARTEPRSKIILTSTDLAESHTGRQLLKYLIECALTDDQLVEIRERKDEVLQVLRGSAGLAPAWGERAMDVVTRRKVTSCILARTNAFGVKVAISIRAAPGRPAVTALQTSATEREEFSIFEGAFFGDIFAPGSPAYVCTGPRAGRNIEALRLRKRICAIGIRESNQSDRSICGFRLVGSCSKPDAFTIDGVTYDDPIFVYLKASSPD